MSENGRIEWYLARDGQQHGPLSQLELDKFIELGHLKPTDLLWRVGFDDWRPAAEVMPKPVAPEPPETVPAPHLQAESTPSMNPADTFDDQPDTEPHPAHGTVHGATRTTGHSEVGHARGRITSPVETSRFGEPVRTFGDVAPEPAAAGLGDRPGSSLGGSLGSSLGSSQNDSAVTIRPDQLQPPGRSRHADPVPQPDWHRQPQNHAGVQPTAQSAGAAHAASDENRQIAPDSVTDDDYYDDEPAGRGGWLMVAAALFVAVLLGAAGLFAYNNQQLLSSYLADLTDRRPATEVAVVKAPREVTREAIPSTEPNRTGAPGRVAKLDPSRPAPIAPAQPATAKAVPELPILKSKLWKFAQQEFGEWAEKRMAELRQLSADDRTLEESNNHLVQSFVTFRRQNAAVALLASPDDLAGVARAFVNSLEALKGKGAQPCYEFISNGEGSPVLSKLYFEPVIGAKLEAQMLAIMKAVAGGKSNNATRLPPTADDFSTLSKELGKRGWTAADLKLFSDPNALSGAEPQVVCRLVTEWFATQTTLEDARTRDQLIAASLRPVIGG